MPMTSRENTLMYLEMEAREHQRELDRLQAKVDAVKLEAMRSAMATLCEEAQIAKGQGMVLRDKAC